MSTYNLELDATEHSCCVVYLWDEGVMSSWTITNLLWVWDEGVMSSWTITNLPWSSYPQLLQFLLSSWAGPVPWPVQPHWPHALSNNIKQVSGQASQNPLACLMTLTTCPVKQHQTHIRSSKSSTLACPTTLTTCPVKQHQTYISGQASQAPWPIQPHWPHALSNIKHISGQASQAPWPVQPHWPHALSNNIKHIYQVKQVKHLGPSNHTDHIPCQTISIQTQVRPSKSSILACPTMLTTCPVKLHPHCNMSGQDAWFAWPVQPHSPHILSNNTERISWSGQAPWPVHPYTHTPNNVKHIRSSKLSTLACLTTRFVKQHPHSNACHFVRPSKSSTLACPTTRPAKQLQTSIRSSKSSTFHN